MESTVTQVMRLADPEQVELLRGDSHDNQTRRQVNLLLEGEPVCLLFIDGDHSYDGVKKDFALYSPLVKREGIIAFHDIAPSPNDSGKNGVPKFWVEIRKEYRHQKFVEDWQGGFGIGLLFVE